jgi:N-dimethylarginine dimethylaminohydrolase
MNSVLMCAPRHYAIKYEINPWMRLTRPVKTPLARTQWQALFETLLRLGVQVSLIPQHKKCPDMVFTANAGVARGKIFIPSHFRYAQRQPETAVFTQFFQKKGYSIADVTQQRYFEGEGDLLPHRNVLFGGFRYRSEAGAHEKVAVYLKKRVILLELIHPRFYHLDTCLFPLDEKTILYYPGAFNAQGRKAIQGAAVKTIPVGKTDAYRFACNAFRAGRTVVLNTVSRELKARLQRLGYQPMETPTSEFVKAGGSVKCLLLKL